MPNVVELLRNVNHDQKQFWFSCPGCNEYHVIPVGGENGWTWNGSLDKPTCTPSLRASWGDGQCCHFWLREGVIDFCPDSTHQLAGKQVPLPESKDD